MTDKDPLQLPPRGIGHKPSVLSTTIPHWPYCEVCEEPIEFEECEPFAWCGCGGTMEWGYPRPASYVMNPKTGLTGNETPTQECP